ncbi:MAG: ABC transporter permease [Blastocatellia bacterium]|nr:ABC transporter permease [Blastocatellia bacterium]
METFLQDLRYGIRMLMKKPGFAAVAVVTLALGIGCNTAIFSVINALLLKPLPYESPERLVRISADLEARDVKDAGVSFPELFDYQERAGVFEGVAGLYSINANLTGVSEPERIEGLFVSANYFSILRAKAAIGRVFLPEDYHPAIAEIGVISDGLWKRRFGGARDIIGKKILLDMDPVTIIGVMPPGFRHPGLGIEDEIELWIPAGFRTIEARPAVRGIRWLSGALARLAPGVTVETARSRLNSLANELKQEYPNDYTDIIGWTPTLTPLQDDLVGKTRPTLLVLFAAVGLVLLIACANVANLLLARASARQRELAIRIALGAGRWRIVRQLLSESLMLSLAGGLLGLLMTLWTMEAIAGLLPENIPQLNDMAVDTGVLVFTLAVTLAATTIFGVVPALLSTRIKPQALKEAARGTTAEVHRSALRSLLVITEFALAMVLLIGAGLLVRSFWQLQSVDPGFETRNILTARFWMSLPNEPESGPYFQHARRLVFYRGVLERVKALPGVEEAGWVYPLPLGGSRRNRGFLIEGLPLESADVNQAELIYADQGYFRAMRIPLIGGRYFADQDDENAPPVLLINEAMARRYFPDEDPVGKRIRPGNRNSTAPWMTVTGVVKDVKSSDLEAEAAPQMYRSIIQTPSLAMTLVLRSAISPASLAESVRREVRATDPNMPVFGIKTMEDVMSATLAERRFSMLLFGLFAAVALLLSTIGIYAVMSYLVQQQTHEIGVRMALGAQQSDIMRLVLGHGFVLTLVGAIIGLGAAYGLIGLSAAYGLSSYISSLLYDLSPTDVKTYIAITLLLMGVSLLACYVPARRATRVDPMQALRDE